MLQRKKHPIPSFVRDALTANGVLADYKSRPAYQQNDYIGWIMQAKRDVTRQKRLQVMIDELRIGGVYMNMKHASSDKTSKKNKVRH